jgi:hypothetical protein
LLRAVSDQLAELRKAKVEVLVLQVLGQGEQAIQDWKKANPAQFLIAQLPDDKAENTGWARNAPALPWLILTDPRRIVTDEGFSLDELNGKLEKAPDSSQ